MMFHDFPWGHNKAPWDVRLTQEEFNLRIAAADQLNTNPGVLSFSLCSPET
jgi:hypothetical protein